MHTGMQWRQLRSQSVSHITVFKTMHRWTSIFRTENQSASASVSTRHVGELAVFFGGARIETLLLRSTCYKQQLLPCGTRAGQDIFNGDLCKTENKLNH